MFNREMQMGLSSKDIKTMDDLLLHGLQSRSAWVSACNAAS
jgi:hypothetical protein